MSSCVNRMAFILFLFFMFGANGCGEKGSQPIARIGGRIITVKEYEDAFSVRKSPALIKKATDDDKLEFLTNMVNRQLLIVAAYRLNLDKDKETVEHIANRAESIVIRRLVDREIVEPQIPEKEVKEFYEKTKKQVKIQEIALKLNNSPTDDELRMVGDKIKEIKAEIKSGVDFVQLVPKYSMEYDPAAPEKSQRDFLKWSAITAEDPIYRAAFSMKKNKISEPIRTNKGYSIIKIIDILPVDVKSFSEEKQRIQNELFRLRGQLLEAKYFDYLNKLREKFDVVNNETNIIRFLQVSERAEQDTLIKPTPKFNFDMSRLIDRFSSEEKNLPLVEYNGGKITIEKFIEEISKFPLTRRPQINDRNQIEEILNKGITAQLLLKKEATAKKIIKTKEVQDQLKSIKESFMYNKIMKTEIYDKVNITDTDLKTYFEEHIEEYKHPERREIREIFVNTEKQANEITRRLKSGEDFIKLAKKYNQRAATKDKDGYRGFIAKDMYGLGKPAFEIQVGEIAGPIPMGNNFSIIKVLSHKDAEYKKFEECKQFIQTKLQRELTEKREKEWMNSLKKEIVVTIYDKRFKNTFADII